MPDRLRLSMIAILLSLTVLLAACIESSSNDAEDDASDDEVAAVAVQESDHGAEDTATPGPGEPSAAPEQSPESVSNEADRPERDQDRLPYWHRWWENTDFENTTVPLDEIRSGGVPPDGIPPIDEPKFVAFNEADEWLEDREPVISIEIEGDARAYPLQIMTWHEIVNDEFGDTAVAVTFCPLCNASVAFDRNVGEHGLMRFGVSGMLRYSDLIMWDDKTESWWQQMTGEAVVGELAGEQLTHLRSVIVSYEEFKETYPDGVVLSRDTGFERTYGNNPYVGYDDINSSPFLFDGEKDDRYPPMERVLTLEINGEPKAYPFSLLEDHPVVHDEVGGEPVVVFWTPGTTSALDQTSIADSRDVGAANAFIPILNGEELTFVHQDDKIRDEQTGSTWNVLGQATSGELEGKRLEEYLNGTHFWFAWAAFQPDTGVWAP
jgi:hypothetical protein